MFVGYNYEENRTLVPRNPIYPRALSASRKTLTFDNLNLKYFARECQDLVFFSGFLLSLSQTTLATTVASSNSPTLFFNAYTSMASITATLALPDGFPDVLREYTRELLRDQPADIYAWSAAYFGARAPAADLPVALELDLDGLRAQIE